MGSWKQISNAQNATVAESTKRDLLLQKAKGTFVKIAKTNSPQSQKDIQRKRDNLPCGFTIPESVG